MTYLLSSLCALPNHVSVCLSTDLGLMINVDDIPSCHSQTIFLVITMFSNEAFFIILPNNTMSFLKLYLMIYFSGLLPGNHCYLLWLSRVFAKLLSEITSLLPASFSWLIQTHPNIHCHKRAGLYKTFQWFLTFNESIYYISSFGMQLLLGLVSNYVTHFPSFLQNR